MKDLGFLCCYFPLFDLLGPSRITLKRIFNPEGVIFGLKCSRRKLRKR